MDQIVFFNINKEFSNKFKDLRFSYQRAHKVSFISSLKQLVSMNFKEEFLLFYFTNDVSQVGRTEILQIQKTWTKCHFCLCTKSSFALDAWKLGVQGFLEFPIEVKRFVNSYRKYINIHSGESKELIVKKSDGLMKIPFDTINYIKASGNYSFICLDDDSKVMQTKQIGKYSFLVENTLQFERVHRSMILNVDKVKAIRDNQLVFYKGDLSLPISKSLASKIKSLLLRE